MAGGGGGGGGWFRWVFQGGGELVQAGMAGFLRCKCWGELMERLVHL